MISHRETRSVPYPAELMYAVVADVEKYPEFLPWVVALRIVSRHQSGMMAEMVVGYSGLRERYTSEVTLDPAARQIDVVQPQVVVALGATAAMYLLGVKQSLSSLRGRWHSCRGAKLVVTYHPAFLLRDPRQKVEAWKDLQMVMAELGLKAPAKK